jgi:chromosome partitioning protein
MKIISFVNMKGGVGKSTLAVNFAWCLATRLHHKVLVIDMDPQFNATQCLLNPEQYMQHKQEDKDTILSVFSNCTLQVSTVAGVATSSPKDIDKVESVELHPNLFLLPGDLSLHRIEMTPGDGLEFKLKRYLEAMSQYNFDYVIIDTPPTPSIWMSSALIASNYYIIPLKPDPLSVTGIDLLNSIIQTKKTNFGLKLQCLGIAMNMVEGNTNVYRDTIAYLESTSWKDSLFKNYIPKRTGIARNQTQGQHILRLNDSNLKLHLVKLTDEILSKIQENP